MRVTVHPFARLRELAGTSEWSCQLPAGSCVADAWRSFEAAHPAVGPFREAVSAAVNAEFAPMTAGLHDGDEIAFLPPVSGGRA
jgi:molybdopterin converting factor subunit 1